MTQEEIDAIYDEVDELCMRSQGDLDDMVDKIKSYLNTELKYVDGWIDDGCGEDEEDGYVMGVSYDFTYKGVDFYLRIFYGDNTREVGTYDLRED